MDEMSAGEEAACITRSENRGRLLQMGSNKLMQCNVSLPRVVGREPDVGDGDDGLSCGGIRV